MRSNLASAKDAAGGLESGLEPGDYGVVMASEYNSRPLVPEVLVDGERWALVRGRPTYDEMLDREAVAGWLSSCQTA
jgi:diaminopimelate decarboxylase